MLLREPVILSIIARCPIFLTNNMADGKRTRIETEMPPDLHPPARSASHDKAERHARASENASRGHVRTLSNPHSRTGTFSAVGGYRAPSASTSPATYSVGLQSPITQRTYSPQSSPPASASVYSSYDLPHHARGTAMASDARPREGVPGGYFPNASVPSPINGDFRPRRPLRSLSSVPTLVHTDTTHSSHGEPTPNLPYQGSSLLPPLDAQKFDRTLPQPIPSVHSLVTSPLDVRPKLPHPTGYSPNSQGRDLEDGSQWPALLRATALARDADLHDDDLIRERGPPS
jgi:hypothetical protein